MLHFRFSKITLVVVFALAVSFAQTYSQFGLFTGEKVQSLSCDDTFLFVGTDKGFYRSNANSPDWKKIISGNCRSVSVGDSLITACCDSGIYVSYESAATMEKVFSFAKNETPQAVAAWESFIWVGTNNGVYFIDPADKTCDTLLDSTNVNKLFVVDTFFFVGTQDGFYYTTPGDSQWEDLVDDVPFTALGGNDTMVVAAGDSGIWSATKKDGMWFALPMDAFPSDSLPTAIISDEQDCFVATDNNGMYWFDNKVSQFHHVNFPSPGIVSAMAIFNNQLFLGTAAGALWTINLNNVPVKMPESKPAPFAKEGIFVSGNLKGVVLHFQWPGKERLSIAIVDCKGRIVYRGLAENESNKAIVAIPGKFSAGTYAVTLTGKSRTVSGKIVLHAE